jgi:hypothetical protein
MDQRRRRRVRETAGVVPAAPAEIRAVEPLDAS